MEYHVLKNFPDLHKNEKKLYISSLDKKDKEQVKEETTLTNGIDLTSIKDVIDPGKI